MKIHIILAPIVVLLAGCAFNIDESSTEVEDIDELDEPDLTPQSGSSMPSGCQCNYTFHQVVCKHPRTGQWQTAPVLGSC